MQTEIAYLKGVGPERARLLKEELNIKTFQDLLHFFPNRPFYILTRRLSGARINNSGAGIYWCT